MTVRFGLIGPGKIADRHLAPALRRVEGAQLWSVLSRDPERAAAFAAEHGAGKDDPVARSLEDMLADDELDAVIIATPDKLHAEQCIAAAEAGKHVFVEKPMATDLDDAERMIATCRRNDVRLGVAYHLRWHAGHRALVEAIRRSDIGRIHHVRAQWSWRAGDASNWRASENVGRWWGLAGVGTHLLDLVRWILVPESGEVAELGSIITREKFRGPHDETAVLSLRFERGATAQIVSSVLFDGPTRFEVYGQRGWFLCEDTLGPHGHGRILTDRGPMIYTAADPYDGELLDFVKAVRDGRPPEVDGIEGRRNVELLLQAVDGTT